jgi:anaerobic ribonucleoside-triphosphate reductase activating protein
MKPGWQLLIKNIDVLVDGKFQEENIDARLNYRGSSNQRLIDVPKSLAYKNVQLIEID